MALATLPSSRAVEARKSSIIRLKVAPREGDFSDPPAEPSAAAGAEAMGPTDMSYPRSRANDCCNICWYDLAMLFATTSMRSRSADMPEELIFSGDSASLKAMRPSFLEAKARPSPAGDGTALLGDARAEDLREEVEQHEILIQITHLGIDVHV